LQQVYFRTWCYLHFCAFLNRLRPIPILVPIIVEVLFPTMPLDLH
jgi:hypothetical protein